MRFARRLLHFASAFSVIAGSIFWGSASQANANTGCYRFVNSTQHDVTIRFLYVGAVPENAILQTTLNPGKSFQDCFNTGTSARAILPHDVAVTPAPGVYSTILMGDDPAAQGAGTYTITPPQVAATPKPASTPEALYVVLKSSTQSVAPGCSFWNPCKTGCLGACPVLHISIKCGPHAPN